MCGIYVSLSRDRPYDLDERTKNLLTARGPDSLQCFSVSFQGHDEPGSESVAYSLVCCSSVLALRGGEVESQPLVDPETGYLLCWNGEAWKIGGHLVTGNDSVQIFQRLLRAAVASSPRTAIAETLTAVAGPFAFVFYDAIASTLYYGRDRLGRRSLVLQKTFQNDIQLCSFAVDKTENLNEVDATSLHAIEIRKGMIQHATIPWATLPNAVNIAENFDMIPSLPSDSVVETLLRHLSESIKLRVQNVPDHGHLHASPDAARIAILFSGGLDCTLVARIANEVLPISQTIDLLNVAFENPRTMKSNTQPGVSPYEICPDRITGRASFAELSMICPQRQWRFVAIDIPYAECQEHRPQIIELMRPHNSEMDLSIAMALFFAARGRGLSSTASNFDRRNNEYSTTARVLLSGLGADELFGGYSRHAAAFARAGYTGLAEELDLDYQRIGQRNLGRDDRVISHWGRETRYPFLDEDFVEYTLSLPVWEKCGFRPDRPIPKHFENSPKVSNPEQLDPAKMVLRLAAWKLGMVQVACERKRAIQFGARTAKMETGGRKKGTDLLE